MTSVVLLREIAAARPPVPGASRDDAASSDAPRIPRGPVGGSNAWAAGRAILGRGNGGFSFADEIFHRAVAGQVEELLIEAVKKPGE
jgi:hypothetical protein